MTVVEAKVDDAAAQFSDFWFVKVPMTFSAAQLDVLVWVIEQYVLKEQCTHVSSMMFDSTLCMPIFTISHAPNSQFFEMSPPDPVLRLYSPAATASFSSSQPALRGSDARPCDPIAIEPLTSFTSPISRLGAKTLRPSSNEASHVCSFQMSKASRLCPAT